MNEKIASKLYQGEGEAVAHLFQQALDQGMIPEKILSEALMPGMDQVGRTLRPVSCLCPKC